ncbi:MAG: VWA domain-containing protein [bacterium]|nr:VWA domain-containing protein [bacterium]
MKNNFIKSFLHKCCFYRDKLLSNKKYVISSIVLIGLLIVFISSSFAALTPTPSITVPSTTLSYSNKEEGAWQYTKSAHWISKGKAKVNIKVDTLKKSKFDYTDVILVLDTSGSMLGTKLTQVQNDVNELINVTIPKGNKIALITFNDRATVVNNFTNDTTLLQESINNLKVSGETNYYQALIKVDDVLSTYNKESNRDCVVLFLTDGLPTIDTPNEVSQYKYLKSKYNYLDINGIQYELGDTVLTGIKNITDTQYLANKDNLDEFLYQASLTTTTYDELTLTDYVDTDHFNLNNVTDVSTTFGNATIQSNKVIWDLSGLKSGMGASLTIDINLNNDLIGVGGIYPTHTKTDILYKIGNISTTESTTETTILKNNYTVVYEGNTPSGCVVSNVPSSKSYSVFDTVQIEDKVPVCAGYQFQGWKIVTAGVKEVNEDIFIMPEKHVTLRATWKKLSITKSMDGTISKVQTLYKLIADSSIGLDTDVDFSSTPAYSSSGVYTREGTENDKYPLYYYRGIVNNNVLFAGFCWKMVRTTSTGGVKLIYNGVYDETNKCNNTQENSLIGTSGFSDDYHSPADVGYMYGTKYSARSTSLSRSNVLSHDLSVGSLYYYGTSVTYSNGTYTLENASQKSWADNYSTLTGYYTCRNTSTTCSTVYYIAGTDRNYQYFFGLTSGITDADAVTLTLGKDAIDNGNGTYSLTDTVVVKKSDWYTNYDTYKNYYMCKDLTSTTCDSKYLITSTNNYQVIYDNTFRYIYGNDIVWDGEKYTLTDNYVSTSSWSIDRTVLSKKYHYTCLNITGECKDVYYIHYFGDDIRIYYLILSSGKNIEDAKNEMFANVNDSVIKQTIDTWYKNNMISYTEKLEDTPWCNDRTISSGSLVGKDEDAGTKSYIGSYFTSYSRAKVTYNPSIICDNLLRDGFTVSTNSGGNGMLDYPVGLLTADETMLAGGVSWGSYLYIRTNYWLLSPGRFTDSIAQSFWSYTDYIESNQTSQNSGVRPSVSLAPGTRTENGTGTADDPYVIE